MIVLEEKKGPLAQKPDDVVEATDAASVAQGVIDEHVDIVGYLLNFMQVNSPVKALLYSAVLNGLVAPPLIVVLLFICNNRKIVGKNANGWLSNTLGGSPWFSCPRQEEF